MPLSEDFKTPTPAYEEREAFTSPVPTQIVPDFQSTVTEPQFTVSDASITGEKEVPLLLVYQSPPVA